MRRPLAVLALTLLAGWPASSYAGNLDLRIGGFFPRANTGASNDLLQDDASLYTVRKQDWNGVSGGFAYNTRVAHNVELGFSLDGYGQTLHTSYRNYTGDRGNEIQQTLRISVVPLGVTFRLIPTGHRSGIKPYLAVGADLFFYQYEEFGDFIDFDQASHPVIGDSFISRGVVPGLHVSGGVRVPLNRDFSLVADARYQWATADMKDDFQGNKLDLTGASFTLGFNLRF